MTDNGIPSIQLIVNPISKYLVSNLRNRVVMYPSPVALVRGSGPRRME